MKRGRRTPPVRLEAQRAARGPGKQESEVSWPLSRGLGGDKVQRCQKSRELEAENCHRHREVCVTLARVFPVGVWSSQRPWVEGWLVGRGVETSESLEYLVFGFLFSFFLFFFCGCPGFSWWCMGSSCSSRAWLPHGLWVLVPQPGIKATSLVLEGGFLRTGPQRSP